MTSLLESGHADPRGPIGFQLFASALDEPRARRPTDVALAIASLLLLVLAAALSKIGANIDLAFTDLIDSFPGTLDALWLIVFWTPFGWSVFLVASALARRRPRLARDLVVSAIASIAVAVVAAAIVTDEPWNVIRDFVDVNGPPSFPPGVLTVTTAVLSTASPHLSRPFRYFGRWSIFGQLAAALLLGAATLAGTVAAISVGLLAAAIVHLTVGSPGGRPTTSRIRLALQGLGITVDDLAPASMHRAGVVLFEGRDAGGPISVKVYGRDAWDGQLLANLWRLLWYRDRARSVRLSRVELVEHEGFVTLLAERAGVRVPRLVVAGSAGRGDALVVIRPDGTPLSQATPEPDDDGIAALWTDLRRLHHAGIVHRRIDFDRVVARDDGTLGFGDLSSASVADTPSELRSDYAQVLATSFLLIGEERAIAGARTALGDDAMRDVLPYLQGAAMTPQLRDGLADQDVDLDDVRERLATTLAVGEQPLIKLRRVTTRSIVNLALLVIAAYTLIGLFSDLDWASFIDALRDASWWWLAFALAVAQIARLPAAVSTMGSIDRPLPLGRLTQLQFAICYVNLAIPSTAARVAINVRFFQRFGVGSTTAISAGVIDSVSGFVVQITIFVLLFLASDLDLGFSLDTGEMSGLATLALLVIGGIIVIAGVVAAVPALRHRAMAMLSEARDSLHVLRSPTKLLQLFVGNLMSQVLFAVALAVCVRAFGEELPLATLLLINTVVSLFAGLLPIPGGIGVSEAGITLGLTTAGLPSETAFAIALAYRFVSFYLPPIWGWFCYQRLVAQRYL